MEQCSQYLMWVKSKNNILENSWEEHDFIEDARGPLGRFVWSPKSFSCSFCRREFMLHDSKLLWFRQFFENKKIHNIRIIFEVLSSTNLES